MISDYVKGLLYGDGSYIKEKRTYFFSTTHKEVSDKVREVLKNLNVVHSEYHRENDLYDNWGILEITEISDKNFIDYLFKVGIISDDPFKRFKDNPDFIRGYLETKGTFFSFIEGGSKIYWRTSFSGSYEDIFLLKEILESWGMDCHEIVRRKERESLGIISESFRLNIQSRKSISIFVSKVYGERLGDIEVTEYLKEKFEKFLLYDKVEPFNRKKKIFKHYKYAALYMSRELGMDLKGKRGGGGSSSSRGGSGFKPIYVWGEGEPVIEYEGWKGAYEELVSLYEESTGFTAPAVFDNKN